MLDTVLLDLDGTLLPIDLSTFVAAYFRQLAPVIQAAGFDAEIAGRAIWQGGDKMLQNDGSRLNCEVFWNHMKQALALDDAGVRRLDELCEHFYRNDFDNLKSLFSPNEAPAFAVKALRRKGYTLVLATNPMFPRSASETRLSWLGLKCEDFSYSTDYANSRFCKPNLDYYREILTKINKTPDQCLMVGNSVVEDMCAVGLGMKTYLVTGFVEGGEGADLSRFERGSLEEFARFAANMPPVGTKLTL